jgi:acetyl-CoA synthetase
MMSPNPTTDNKLSEVAGRIREMREISDFTVEEMAAQTDTTPEEYIAYENGDVDLPFTFIHKCALAFGLELTNLLEGSSPKLKTYAVTRNGQGQTTVDENGIRILSMVPRFQKKIADPYWVRYEYKKEEQDRPIHLSTHKGQEFDYIIKGHLKVQVGDHTEILGPGDSIYYHSHLPHGMIAVDGEDCDFLAIILPGEEVDEVKSTKIMTEARQAEPWIVDRFIRCEEDELGRLRAIDFEHEEEFNFAYDVVDALADKYPEKLAMLHIDKDHNERRFSFKDMKHMSNRTANYFTSLGIRKGDRVMLILKRHYQFWLSMLALHKIGAIPIPATNQLKEHDIEYRLNAAGISAVICTADGVVADEADKAISKCPQVTTKVIVRGDRAGWHSFDSEYSRFTGKFPRTEDSPCGSDPMFMLFTSGTTGYPKIACHSYKYALGHYVTAKYWQDIQRDGLHLTISETGWGKALWGKLYGQWMGEGAVFVYDFDRFDANDILPMFKQYNITSFCAPPTMLRMMVKEDLSRFDLSSIKHMTTAGEALNPEVFRQFKKATGLTIMEGFGQTETTLTIANLRGEDIRIGSMGRPNPLYDVDIVDSEGNSVPVGENGEIVVRTDKRVPCGLFDGYFKDPERTEAVWYDDMYHTGDVAWRDEDNFFWYVGRVDDVIKSSGYRIGPFEIESVIMELPYVLECGVSPAPDEIRGQVVKASIVLTKGTVPSEELKKEIQEYVKKHTAPYKYPRIVVFRDELPKSISGKIQRNQL